MNLEVLKLKANMILASIGVFLLGFALAFAVVSYFFGVTFAPAVIVGILSFLVVLNILQWLFGPYLINAMYRAVEVTPSDPRYGWLVPLVNEVAMYNGIEAPKVYIADVPFPNAFAYGSPIAGKRVAITLPLLKILNKDEIKAVLGHELGHLKHKDVQLLMAIGLIPALIFYIGYSLMWSGMLGGGERNNNSGVMWLVGVALLAVSYLFQFLVLYVNRLREAYADVNSAQTIPGGAHNLQRALAKITLATDPEVLERYRNRGAGNGLMSMLFFAPTQINGEVSDMDVEELINYWKTQKVPWYADFFSDHPATPKRIQLLEKLKFR
ncbi:MAG: heat shock protein HtpX [Candidatus Aramenus sulfurataquae]|jgi:heat shock protein HtpX|uniref:Protease HtpX homolog n=2 Tax=Candidatus Aramenus sulfurataquae TaxID=1326980 RepID=W7KMF4_9CREN|nr:MAG: heat shock protein HtpX [Candidatus Aramenus sulfurataquae]MCL7343202.1 zinc metalloprotease HtpX [Candidatus Aramenus sulfurataquae]